MAETCDRKFERWRKKGDTHALADVFDAIAPRLMRLAVHLVGDVAAAEDLVQSTFVTAIEDAAAWDPSRPLEPWLTGILDNRAKRLLKSRDRPLERAGREDVDHDTPLVRAMESEMSVEIVKAIDQLDEPYRSVMVLSLLHHLEPAAIAHALDRSPGSVRVQLHRGREMVRKLLPAGVLTSALIVASSGRGLAALKSAVLAHASGSTVMQVAASTGGIVVMKKLLLAMVALVLLTGGVTLVAKLTMPEHAESTQSESVLQAEETIPGEKRVGLGQVVASVDSRRSMQAAPNKLVVTGRVLNSGTGTPSDGDSPASDCPVSIAVVADTANAPPQRRLETITDELGNFRFEVDDPPWPFVGVYLKSPADEKFCTARRSYTARSVVPSIDGLDLVRGVRSALRGIVLDEHDTPLAGIPIKLINEDYRTAEPVKAESDASGRFEMRPEEFYHAHFTAELDGHSMFGNVSAERDDHGGWKDAVIVLARRGRLRIHLQDCAGDPLQGQVVTVDADSREPRRSKEQFSLGYGIGVTVHTDAQGIATFDDLWMGKRLQLDIFQGPVRSPNLCSSSRMRDGRILFTENAEGEPIVIGPSGILDLVAQYEPDVVLHGVVLRPDRSPVAGAFVEARDADAPMFQVRYPVSSARADAQGRFELHARREAGLRRLSLMAAEREWKNVMQTTQGIETLTCAGSIFANVTEVDPERVIEIPLVQLQSIAGRIVKSDGSPIWAIVSAVTAGSGFDVEANCVGRPAVVSNSAAGAFRLENVPPGRYDLVVQIVERDRATFPIAVQRYPDIEAGSNVTLVFEGELKTHVHVRAVSKYGDVRSIQILRGRRILHGSTVPAGEALEKDITVHSLAEWPLFVPPEWGDVRRMTSPDYRDSYSIDGCKTSERDLPAMSEAWGFIGVCARLVDGRECFPMSTGLVHMVPGEHTITFDVVPITVFEGRLTGQSVNPTDEIALVDQDGRLLPLRGSSLNRKQLLSSVGLRDDGWFRFENAPLGEFRVRVGSRNQLERGEFRLERKVEVGANGPPIEIDVASR